ncbi:hypothetical protein [Escherichia coli]|uniref:hypothetical protein n=1 Tax=Escherichia coli TaxID=562 RepID=UPI001FCD72AE|nr:hypothetical protein [Escherichia coli]
MGSCAAPSAKRDDKFITTDYLQQCLSEYFSPPYPARATLGIAALPQGAVIEIEAIMVL